LTSSDNPTHPSMSINARMIASRMVAMPASIIVGCAWKLEERAYTAHPQRSGLGSAPAAPPVTVHPAPRRSVWQWVGADPHGSRQATPPQRPGEKHCYPLVVRFGSDASCGGRTRVDPDVLPRDEPVESFGAAGKVHVGALAGLLVEQQVRVLHSHTPGRHSWRRRAGRATADTPSTPARTNG
jgi:hypothetical protein